MVVEIGLPDEVSVATAVTIVELGKSNSENRTRKKLHIGQYQGAVISCDSAMDLVGRDGFVANQTQPWRL